MCVKTTTHVRFVEPCLSARARGSLPPIVITILPGVHPQEIISSCKAPTQIELISANSTLWGQVDIFHETNQGSILILKRSVKFIELKSLKLFKLVSIEELDFLCVMFGPPKLVPK